MNDYLAFQQWLPRLIEDYQARNHFTFCHQLVITANDVCNSIQVQIEN